MLRVCSGFLDKLFFLDDSNCNAEDETCAIDSFDNCGMIIEGTGVFPSEYFVDANGNPDYLKFLEEVRPPYFSTQDFDISVEYFKTESSSSNDTNFYIPWDEDAMCFSTGTSSTISAATVVFAAVFALYSSL